MLNNCVSYGIDIIDFTTGDLNEQQYKFSLIPPEQNFKKCEAEVVYFELWAKRYCKGKWQLTIKANAFYQHVETLDISFENPKDATYFKLYNEKFIKH